ncbi:cytochrome P450 [Thermothelomyces heterothallicus CBS 202.75]|uniref:cytochrome P450 n=1 Tax=Thermothelomyces heterothallicus CBS 202.75 TaxID=1149848 RepID=UPI003743688B
MLQVLFSATSLVLLLATALGLAIRRVFFSGLWSVPGPFVARLTDLWYAYRVLRGRFEKDNVELHRKYGPVVRYGVNRYSIADPLAANAIYGPGNKFTKSSWYQPWSSPSPQDWALFADQDAKRHASNRRQYQNTYNMSALVHYEAYVDECVELLCQRLSGMGANNAWSQPVDMGHWLQCYAFDVISLMTYSRRIGFLDAGQDVGNVIQNIDDALAYASVVGVYPWLHPILFGVRNWLAGSRGKGRQYIISFTKECMAAHQEKPSGQPVAEKNNNSSEDQRQQQQQQQQQQPTTLDFLSKFLQKHTETPSAFTRYHVLAGCVSNMMAGSDTTSISLGAILYHALRNPAVIRRLREEVDQLCPRDHDENAASPRVTFAQSQDMPYLQAVIKEALRVHPATGLPLERVVPEEGLTFNGIFFPAGTIVGINSWVEHSNKEIFGDDADVFNPDRWLHGDKEKIRVMNRHWMPVSFPFAFLPPVPPGLLFVGTYTPCLTSS